MVVLAGRMLRRVLADEADEVGVIGGQAKLRPQPGIANLAFLVRLQPVLDTVSPEQRRQAADIGIVDVGCGGDDLESLPAVPTGPGLVEERLQGVVAEHERRLGRFASKLSEEISPAERSAVNRRRHERFK